MGKWQILGLRWDKQLPEPTDQRLYTDARVSPNASAPLHAKTELVGWEYPHMLGEVHTYFLPTQEHFQPSSGKTTTLHREVHPTPAIEMRCTDFRRTHCKLVTYLRRSIKCITIIIADHLSKGHKLSLCAAESLYFKYVSG